MDDVQERNIYNGLSAGSIHRETETHDIYIMRYFYLCKNV
jgi:hypothetical protein